MFQARSVAATSDGGFTVVWAQRDSVALDNSWDVWGRAFSASGTPVALDFRINTYLYGDQYQPKIAAGPAGSLVVWTSLNEVTAFRARACMAAFSGWRERSALGDEFRVNTTTISQQMASGGSAAWDGDLAISWWCGLSFTGQQGFDLFGQLYSVNASSGQ